MARHSKKSIALMEARDVAQRKADNNSKAVSDLVAGRVLWLTGRVDGHRIGVSRLTGPAGGIVLLDDMRRNGGQRHCQADNLDSWIETCAILQRSGHTEYGDMGRRLRAIRQAAYDKGLGTFATAKEMKAALAEVL